MIGRCAVTAIQGVLDHRDLESVKPRAINSGSAGKAQRPGRISQLQLDWSLHWSACLFENPLLGAM